MENRRYIGATVFVRHGESKYTDVFPDVTENGRRAIMEAAFSLMPFRDSGVQISTVCSPAVRARGSAAIFIDVLGIADEPAICPFLSPVMMYDRAKCAAIFQEYIGKGGMPALCVAYRTDARFEDGVICEPRSRVAKRFYKYLAMLARNLLASRLCAHVVHFENVCHIGECLFGKSFYLGPGEMIALYFYETGKKGIVEIYAILKGKEGRAFFDLENEMLVESP